MDSYTKLAQKTIEEFVKNKKIIQAPKDLPDEILKNKAGVFVTLHKAGDLRGCIGTFLPTKKNIAEEIIANAISSAIRDPRFDPVTKDELKDLEISVDVLSTPEAIDDPKKLDPKKYGVIIETEDGRSGLLLPAIEGVKTIADQITIAAEKADIDPLKEKYYLFRFTVERHK